MSLDSICYVFGCHQIKIVNFTATTVTRNIINTALVNIYRPDDPAQLNCVEPTTTLDYLTSAVKAKIRISFEFHTTTFTASIKHISSYLILNGRNLNT
jgi:hypothetical protein